MGRSGDNGAIPDGWQMVQLGDVAEVVGGSTPSRREATFWGGNTPWVVPSELTDLPGRYLTASRESITEKGVHSAGLRVIPEGSVLLTSRATIGVTAINAMPLATNQGFQNLVVNGRAEALWLYYSVSGQRKELEKRASGSTFKEVSRDSVRSLPILLPPLSEQRAIAAVLDSIDDAIERTDAVIAATEQLRDSLLHELLTRGVPGWHTEWKEAPGIGTIPANWEVVRLGDVAEVAFSSVDKRTVDGEVPVELCNYTDVFYSRRIRPGMRFMAATASPVECDRWALRKNDVLFTKDSETPDEIGIPAYVTADMPTVLCGYHLGLARPRMELADGAYLAELLGSPRTASRFARIANGVTRFGLTLGATNSLSIPLPALREQQTIASVLTGVDAAIEQGHEERERLQALKGSASEALLTGRVRMHGRTAAKQL